MIPIHNLKRQCQTLKIAIDTVVEETLPTCQELNELQTDRKTTAVTAAGG